MLEGALLQRRAARRLGENDAWLVATADLLDAEIVGAGPRAPGRAISAFLLTLVPAGTSAPPRRSQMLNPRSGPNPPRPGGVLFGVRLHA